MLRGRVVDVYGQSLVAVRVSVITQPLHGFTLTRPHRAQYVTLTRLFFEEEKDANIIRINKTYKDVMIGRDRRYPCCECFDVSDVFF